MQSNRLADCAHRASARIKDAQQSEDDALEAWLEVGAALNEGKDLTKDPNCGIAGPNPDARFGAWKKQIVFSGSGHTTLAAAMWAAAGPKRFNFVRELHNNRRSVRGLHEAWKSTGRIGPETKPTELIDPALDQLECLRSLSERLDSADNFKEVQSCYGDFMRELLVFDAVLKAIRFAAGAMLAVVYDNR